MKRLFINMKLNKIHIFINLNFFWQELNNNGPLVVENFMRSVFSSEWWNATRRTKAARGISQ